MRVSKSGFLTNRTCFWIIGFCLMIQILLFFIERKTAWVEFYYSRIAYHYIEYFPKILFSWIPFSFGDLFYIVVSIWLISSVLFLFWSAFKKRFLVTLNYFLRILSVVSFLYTFFYVNWGLNYYREPLYVSMKMDVSSITKEDYLNVLEKYIHAANVLRDSIDYVHNHKNYVREDVEQMMLTDTIFGSILSKTQVKIKEPISSSLVSYFLVSGYFNPFTSEVQVNQNIPMATYPFVNVHEVAHQMGVGFEDDCNFIAFRKLINHPNMWYRYSAYYNAIQSLLEPVYGDIELLGYYKSLLSIKVIDDLREESSFWASHRGWLDGVSSLFYDGYLKHNNQPEGLDRYGMMARLIVAWEKQQ